MGTMFQNDEIGSNERRIFAFYEVGEGLHLLQSIILFLCHQIPNQDINFMKNGKIEAINIYQ